MKQDIREDVSEERSDLCREEYREVIYLYELSGKKRRAFGGCLGTKRRGRT